MSQHRNREKIVSLDEAKSKLRKVERPGRRQSVTDHEKRGVKTELDEKILELRKRSETIPVRLAFYSLDLPLGLKWKLGRKQKELKAKNIDSSVHLAKNGRVAQIRGEWTDLKDDVDVVMAVAWKDYGWFRRLLNIKAKSPGAFGDVMICVDKAVNAKIASELGRRDIRRLYTKFSILDFPEFLNDLFLKRIGEIRLGRLLDGET